LYLDFLDALLSSTPFLYKVNKNLVVLHSDSDAFPVLQMWVGQQEWHLACIDWVLVCCYVRVVENYSEMIEALHVIELHVLILPPLWSPGIRFWGDLSG